ncbi:MAG: antibiotic biosynthesis monooxygenase [Anaerolineales bacterium]|nr:antibiotic biosynthesis monooxygenase [Anaerolineales bacterium]
MIVIAGTVRIDVARRDEALALAQWISDASETEPGCLGYRIYADLADPATLFIFEQWTDEAALQAHFETEHLRQFQARLPEFVVGPMSIERFDVLRRERL